MAPRDQRTPWYAWVLAVVVVGYALSPIDLIPDFIPILGYLDDLVLLPLGIWLTIRLIPEDVLAECRAAAESNGQQATGRHAWLAAVLIIAIWVVVIGVVVRLVVR